MFNYQPPCCIGSLEAFLDAKVDKIHLISRIVTHVPLGQTEALSETMCD
jgi:hypothetical protein